MPTQATKTECNPCGYLDDARRLWKQKLCLEPVSKNVKGKLDLLNRERQECEDPKCLTLKTNHFLRLEVNSHQPCDSVIGQRLDGRLAVTNLVHAFNGGTGMGRGVHTGEFTWWGNGIEVQGEISGMTNVGTHREPVFDPCQECHDPGYMEGRLCGRITKAENEKLLGCRVVAAYRFRYEPSEECDDADIVGTIEGAVVCTCDQGKCVNFSSFPPAQHPNPWEVNGCRFHVFDHQGSPTPTTSIEPMGGFVGLDAGYETRITLGAPATAVSVTLINFSTPPTVVALDAGGSPVDSAVVAASGVVETIELTGPGIVAVGVRSPQNETLILEFCAQG
ncbi:MAG: hypothetical protein ACR2QK_03375 [Acidimicrobiales bacterium]